MGYSLKRINPPGLGLAASVGLTAATLAELTKAY